VKTFILREFDEYFTANSQVFLGVFSSRENAQKAIKERYLEDIYSLVKNGDNQWFIEKAQGYFF